MGLRQKFRNFHVVLSRPPFLAAIRKATLCGVRPASTMVPAEAELESRSPGWRNSAYQWAAHICDFVVHRKKGREPNRALFLIYAGATVLALSVVTLGIGLLRGI